MQRIKSRLKDQNYLLLDGGLATELEKIGCNLDHPLWSAKVLIEAPDLIKNVNRSYLEAGSDIIATASYQLSYEGARNVGISSSEATVLLHKSVAIGFEAIEAHIEAGQNMVSPPFLAASMGPFGAFLANGSEYTGKYAVTKNKLWDFHKKRWDIFARTRVDMIAFETIPNIYEAEIIRRLCEEFPEKPIWVSFCTKDATQLSDGSAITEVASFFGDLDHVLGIGINCTAPSNVLPLIEAIKPVIGEKEILVYPNSGELYDVDQRCWIGEKDPGDYANNSIRWFEAGANILGGCCRTSPEHIARMKVLLNEKISRV